MTESLTPAERAGIFTVNAAIHLYLQGEHHDALRVLANGVANGLTEEITTGLLGVAINALERLGEATGTDPLTGWTAYMNGRPQ